MQDVNIIKKIKQRDWIIVPRSSKTEIELSLALCTGIIAYQRGMEDAPYLVVHSSATEGGGIPPEFAMVGFMTANEFNETPESENRISLNDIFDIYQHQLKEESGLNGSPQLGVYLASGFRANPTDLVIARVFLSNFGSELQGAELNNPVTVRLNPLERLINLFGPIPGPDEKPFFTYTIGQKYEMNLNF